MYGLNRESVTRDTCAMRAREKGLAVADIARGVGEGKIECIDHGQRIAGIRAECKLNLYAKDK